MKDVGVEFCEYLNYNKIELSFLQFYIIKQNRKLLYVIV